jgi:hypothetical protein
LLFQGEVKVVEQLGKFFMVARPGYNCLLPCLCQFVKGHLSMRLMQLDITCETKTNDNVFVVLKVGRAEVFPLAPNLQLAGGCSPAIPMPNLDPDPNLQDPRPCCSQSPFLPAARGVGGLHSVQFRLIYTTNCVCHAERTPHA